MKSSYFDQEDTLALLKQLTIQDFLDVGLHQIAYIKRVENDKESSDIYSIHAANGSQISVMDSYDTAVAAIWINDLLPVTVH